jgi:hypothetical protein
MPCIGLLTDYGSEKTIEAMANEGYYIKPKRFYVFSMAGEWTTARTPEDIPITASWFNAPISGAHRVGVGAVEFSCIVPPDASIQEWEVKEIQIYAEDSNGEEFFLGFGWPGTPPDNPSPISWFPKDMLELRLQIIIAPLAVSQVFDFSYTQVQEIGEHNLNPEAHPFILALLKKYGITINQEENNYAGTWIDPYPDFDILTIKNGDWVYRGERGQYRLAIADGSFSETAPGMMRISDEGDCSVVYGGLVSVPSLPMPLGTILYLSNIEAGKVTASPTGRALGVCLGGTMYLTSAGGAGGGGGGAGALTFCGIDSENDVIVRWTENSPDTVVFPYAIAESFAQLEAPIDIGQYGLCEKSNGSVSMYKSTGVGVWGNERIVETPEIFNFASFKSSFYNNTAVLGAIYWFFGDFIFLEFSMEIATATSPGIVMVDGITTKMDGQLIKVPIAKNNSLGLVIPDGVTNSVNLTTGLLETPIAADKKLGLVKPDGKSTFISGGYLSAQGSGAGAFPSGNVIELVKGNNTHFCTFAMTATGWFSATASFAWDRGADIYAQLFKDINDAGSSINDWDHMEKWLSVKALLQTACSIEKWPGSLFIPVSNGQIVKVATEHYTSWFNYKIVLPTSP